MCDFVSSFALYLSSCFCSNWIFGSGTQCLLAHKVSVFRVEEMDLDDSREIRVNSGQVIGLIMLLLAMLPRDIRSDLVDRLHRMTTQEMVDWYRTSTAASSERAGNSTVDPTSEGEMPESVPQLLLENISLREKCRSLLRMKEIRCSKESTCRQFLDLSL